MTETHRYSVSVAAAVIREDGKILTIQRRDNGRWEPPGGVLEPGETILEGLVREVREETGYIIDPGPLTGVYQNMERDILALVYRCRATSGSPRTSEESLRVEWLTPEAVRQRMAEAYAIRLLDALNYEGRSSVRAHDGQQLRRPGQSTRPQ